LIGLTKRQVKDKLAELQIEWDAQGSGWVVAQDPSPGTPLSDVALCRLVFSNVRNSPLPAPAPVENAKISALAPKPAKR
jgi:hypothetical protein